MASREEILKAIEKHGSKAAAARAIGIPESTLKSTLRRGGSKPAPEPKAVGRTIAEFRNTYDKATIIPRKVKDALKKMGSKWEYESIFARLAGVSMLDLSAVRDQFEAHIVVVDRSGKRAWAGTAATAQELREMVPL